MFAAYVALFRGVVGEKVIHLEWSESYQITMAGLAATRLFSAGGAGGILLTYWALRKAGMERRQSVCRMIAFLVVLYSVYLLALVVFGVLLRTGVLSGEAPLSGTVDPGGAGRGGDRRRAAAARSSRRTSSAGSSGTHRGASGRSPGGSRPRPRPSRRGRARRSPSSAIPQGGPWRSAGRSGSGAPTSRSSGRASTPSTSRSRSACVVQGFFLGMVANLFPFAPGGVGAVDAGMIGAFVLFGLPSAEVFAAVLTYRVIAFWLPIPPGIIAFFQLRKTVKRWEAEGRERPERESAMGEPETAAAAGS